VNPDTLAEIAAIAIPAAILVALLVIRSCGT
jgi:hypothetical protein